MSVTTDRTGGARGPATRTASEIMTPNPKSIRGETSVEEAIAFLVDTGYSAAPVIDEAGRAIGVISRTDVVVYDRAKVLLPESKGSYFETAGSDEDAPTTVVRVADLMNPEVFAVTQDTPLGDVADRMVALNVHRLFVV